MEIFSTEKYRIKSYKSYEKQIADLLKKFDEHVKRKKENYSKKFEDETNQQIAALFTKQNDVFDELFAKAKQENESLSEEELKELLKNVDAFPSKIPEKTEKIKTIPNQAHSRWEIIDKKIQREERKEQKEAKEKEEQKKSEKAKIELNKLKKYLGRSITFTEITLSQGWLTYRKSDPLVLIKVNPYEGSLVVVSKKQRNRPFKISLIEKIPGEEDEYRGIQEISLLNGTEIYNNNDVFSSKPPK